MKSKRDNEAKYPIGYFVFSFLMVFVISFLVLFFLEKEVRLGRISELKRQEQRVVQLETDYLGHQFSMVVSDLAYLHHAFKTELSEAGNHAEIASHWAELSTQRQIYDQIRYIDAGGDEKIRINIGKDGGYAVPEEDLQNKKDRYYFSETMKLDEESVYVSPLDLNMELGEIEMPYKPMIRVSTPVYDETGALKGVIVLNYLAEYMLSGFRDLAENSEGEILLLNAAGYRLSSSEPERDWNFMFEEKQGDTFEREYPEEWQAILEQEGQFTTENGLLTAAPVALNRKYNTNNMNQSDQKLVLGDGIWYVVSIFERTQKNRDDFNDNLVSLLLDVFNRNLFYFSLISIVSLIVGFLAYMNRKTYERIKYHSEFDSLTKTLNRRAGIAKLNALFPEDDRRHFLVSLCFIDINGLKDVNDTLGHKLGDELITSVSECIRETIRDQDFLVRLGGDEFLIVFTGIDGEGAEQIWSRIVQRYDQINTNENRPYVISVSHGIVDFENGQRTRVDELIKTADEKMYQEKLIIKVGLQVVKKKGI